MVFSVIWTKSDRQVLAQVAGQEEKDSDPLFRARSLQTYLAAMLSSHATKDEVAQIRSATLQARKVRRSSLHLLKALDHQLQFVGLSLNKFVVSYQVPGPLLQAEERYRVPWEAWPYDVPLGVPKKEVRSEEHRHWL